MSAWIEAISWASNAAVVGVVGYAIRAFTRLEAETKAHRHTTDKFIDQDREMHKTISKNFQTVDNRLGAVETNVSDMRGRMDVWAQWWNQGGPRN